MPGLYNIYIIICIPVHIIVSTYYAINILWHYSFDDSANTDNSSIDGRKVEVDDRKQNEVERKEDITANQMLCQDIASLPSDGNDSSNGRHSDDGAVANTTGLDKPDDSSQASPPDNSNLKVDNQSDEHVIIVPIEAHKRRKNKFKNM